MDDKLLIKHIKNKLFEKNEIYDHFDVPSDDIVRYIMLVTFDIVESQCQKCFFCQNYKRFSIFSKCKIKDHTMDNCYHFTMDVQKIMKNKYYKIMVNVSDGTWGKYLGREMCPPKTKRNIIYESIKLYDALKTYKTVMYADEFTAKGHLPFSELL